MKSNGLLIVLVIFLLIGLTGILPAQTVIKVAAGTDVISGAMATAPMGAIIELSTSGGQYVQTGDINVTKDVTVRAAAGLAQKPVIYCGGSNVFNVNGGGLTLSGIKFDDPAGGLYFISVRADTVLKGTNTTDFSLRIDNCEFWHCGQRCIYTSDGTMHPLEFLIVTNSQFFDNVKQIIYEKGIRNTPTNPTQPAGAKYIKFENDLIVGTSSSSDGYATYIEPANRDSASYTYPTVVLNHLTVDSMQLGGISTYTTPNATVMNCMVINMKDTSKYAYQVETGRFANAPRSHVWNSIYNGPHFVSYGSSSSPGYAYPDTAKIIYGTPTFNNAGARDYSLKAGSLGKGAGTDGFDIGYIPGGLRSSTSQVIQVAAGTDVISGAMATAPIGAIIELTTSGGQYVQTGDINVTKDVTVRAAAGLVQKPVIYCGGSNVFNVNGGGLTLSGIKFDDPAGGLYFISVRADTVLKGTNTTDFSLRIDNCEFWHCGQRCIYTSDGTMHPLEFLIVTNSKFFDNVKQIIYEKGIRNTPTNPTQPAGAKYIKFENDLIVGTSSSSDGYATYIEPANRDSAKYTYPTVVLNHLTVDSMQLGGISTYTTPNATITNCMVINMKDTSKYAYQVETGRFANAPRSHILNSIYNGPHFASYGSTAFAQYPDTQKIIFGTPTFTNAGARDYSLKAGSIGKNAGTDGKDLGYIPAGLATDVEIFSSQVPTSFQLWQNYPNPFNPTTTIQFSIPKTGRYSIQVFNILGQKVASLFDKEMFAGTYKMQFDASRLSSGMYIYTLRGSNVNISQKMMLLK